MTVKQFWNYVSETDTLVPIATFVVTATALLSKTVSKFLGTRVKAFQDKVKQ